VDFAASFAIGFCSFLCYWILQLPLLLDFAASFAIGFYDVAGVAALPYVRSNSMPL
jgi:hypothetical protein